MADDYIFLQAAEVIFFTLDCSVCKNTCCFLERTCRYKGICCKSSLCNTLEHWTCNCRLTAFCNDTSVFFTEVVFINLLSVNEFCISNRYDFYLAEHLANNYTNMLVGNCYTLCRVYALNFVHKVIHQRIFTEDCKNIMCTCRTVTKLFTCNYLVAITNQQAACHWNNMFKLFSVFIFYDDNTFTFCNSLELNTSGNLCEYARNFRFSCFEQF